MSNAGNALLRKLAALLEDAERNGQEIEYDVQRGMQQDDGSAAVLIFIGPRPKPNESGSSNGRQEGYRLE